MVTQYHEWHNPSPTAFANTHLILYGVNIAGFIGALYTARITTASDVHACLHLLIAHPHANFDRLCAMHALVVHGDSSLCREGKNAEGTRRFYEELKMQDVEGMGEGWYIWGRDGPAKFMVSVSPSLQGLAI